MGKTNQNNLRVLVGQFHMDTIGGTEDFTYTLCTCLRNLGHTVDLITFRPGILSEKLEALNIDVNKLKPEYDICLCNHNIVVNEIRRVLPNIKIIQTSHGIIPDLERFSSMADEYVSISQEIQEHEKNYKSKIIWNGIDVNRFTPINPIKNKIKTILSLTQSNNANKIISEVATKLNCKFVKFDKNINPKFEIEQDINNADLVFGLGRSAYSALAAGRPVFVWDWRHYMGNLGDGFLTRENYKEFMINNTSGRRYKTHYSVDKIVNEIKENYSPILMDDMRSLALEEFNMDKQIEKYLA